MALVNKSFSVSVTPGMMPPIVHVSEYDVGRAYTVSILDEQGNTFTIPSGTTASIEGTLNGLVGFTKSATVSNNQVSFTLSQDMTAYSGKAWCKIKLTLNSEPIQTCAFILAVDRAGVEAETVIGAPGFEEQIQDAVDDYLDNHGGGILPSGGQSGQALVSDGQGGAVWGVKPFQLPSGGQSGQALLSDGANGAYWGAAQGGGSGLSDEAKSALLACFQNVAWINDQGQTCYDALEAALYPAVNLVSISAVYSGGTVGDDASLDDLRQDLVVRALYDDQSTEVVTGYTLSGTLTVGTSTITVTYRGKTTTFDVSVTSEWDYNWDLTKSLVDTVGGVTAVASAGSGVDAPAITGNGLAFTAATQRLSLGDIDLSGKIIEIGVASMNFVGATVNHIRFLTSGMANAGNGAGPIIYKAGDGWSGYGMSGSTPTWATSTWMSGTAKMDRNYFSGKTLRLVNNLDNSRELYIDGILVGTITNLSYANQYTTDVAIGGCTTYSQSLGDQCYNMVIRGIRIKDVEAS